MHCIFDSIFFFFNLNFRSTTNSDNSYTTC